MGVSALDGVLNVKSNWWRSIWRWIWI